MITDDLDDDGSPPTEFDALQGIGQRYPIPPFRVVGLDVEPVRQDRRRAGPDAIIDLEWDGLVQRFTAEYKSLATPQMIERVLEQLRRYTRDDPAVAPLIVAPYLRPEMLERLVNDGVSGIDLSGNYAVVVPGRWLVMRTGARNRYPSSAPIKNVFRGKSSVVARALMLKGEFASPTAIMKDVTPFGAVSLPTVSKVLKSLEEELIIDRSEGIRVVQPDRLLDNLASNYQAPAARRRMFGRIGLTPDIVSRLDDNSTEQGILYAADSPAQYTVLPSSEDVTRVYTLSMEKLLSGLNIDTMSRFPDVELLETTSMPVFYGRRQRHGLYWTSPLQVYLELTTGGKRERQAAAQMRADLLAFKYR